MRQLDFLGDSKTKVIDADASWTTAARRLTGLDPVGKFSFQEKHTGATSTIQIDVEVSLDGTNFASPINNAVLASALAAATVNIDAFNVPLALWFRLVLTASTAEATVTQLLVGAQ